MKCTVATVMLLSAGMLMHVRAQGPVGKVVTLLTELKAKVEMDGKSQQQSYDKFACWCERTLQQKAKDITDAKTGLEEMQKLILQLNGEIGNHVAEIAQLKKDIAKNKKDQEEATDMRKKQHEEYSAERIESENCIASLESAIGILTGAGTGKKFLETSQQTELLSVVGGVRRVLTSQLVPDSVDQEDIDVVKRFVEGPTEFVALQTGSNSQNPNGDYAPASGQIQGILKGMYDAFTADLEKSNVQEAVQVKNFETLMATKKQEQDTLTATLEKQVADESKKKDLLAKTISNRDSTAEQLKADEIFFKETKHSCKFKAKDWAAVSRLRTMELQGFTKALEILTGPEAQKTFGSSSSSFLQTATSQKKAATRMKAQRAMVVQKLKTLAMSKDSMVLAKMAMMARLGGHFDKVIAMCDKMIETLRKEEQADIAHKDRCEAAQADNENQIADFQHTIKKTDESIGRMNDAAAEIQKKIEIKEAEIKDTEKEMKELLDMRNEEEAKFKTALANDLTAKKTIASAIDAMSAFYKENKIPVGFVQETGPDKEYSVDKNAAPDTSFGGGGGDASSQSGGIISIMSMLVEDLEKEIAESRADDAEDQKEYEADRDDLQATKDKLNAGKVKLEQDLADKEMEVEDAKSFKAQTNEDLDAQMELHETLEKDCAWIKNDFESRRDKRKKEIDGLMDAKNILGGAEPDDDLEFADE